ncbi:MAG: NUDIX domain-containing protein [Chloroflexota bacterium]
MGFMRLGTRVAVINEKREILLSKRGDFGMWALPGGRVDSGEWLRESALREVKEETGLDVEIVRTIGLYYQQGRSRTNILYEARPIGGELFTSTDETLDNRYFAQNALPDERFGDFYIQHAFDNETHLYTLETPAWELFKIDMQLRWRWIQNLLAGRPEPSFVKFDIRAVGIILDDTGIPIDIVRKASDGNKALHTLLSGAEVDRWQWVGVWQDRSLDKIEFVFTRRVNSSQSAHKKALTTHEKVLVDQVQNSIPVWEIGQ